MLHYSYQCWPDGPLSTYVDFDFHRLSFPLQNECLCKMHEKHLIFIQMTVQVTYNFIPIVSHKDSFCHRSKSKPGIGLFIHELLRESLITLFIPFTSYLHFIFAFGYFLLFVCKQLAFYLFPLFQKLYICGIFPP